MLLCKMSSIRVSIPTIFVGRAFKSLVLRGFLGTGARKKKGESEKPKKIVILLRVQHLLTLNNLKHLLTLVYI